MKSKGMTLKEKFEAFYGTEFTVEEFIEIKFNLIKYLEVLIALDGQRANTHSHLVNSTTDQSTNIINKEE